jgi:hypothetical protein
MTPSRRFVLALASVAACCAALPAAAQAAPDQLSMMMDDDLLVYRDDATRDQAMKRMKDLGVDYLRVTVLWSVVAEDARFTKAQLDRLKGKRKSRARAQNKRFKADNPRTYPRENWDRYDELVKSASRMGLGVYFNVTGPGPAWAHGKAPKGMRPVVAKAWRPNATEYGKFVRAVGKRFNGRYRDENRDRIRIPRVSFWSLWNEPNQAGWLAPQWAGSTPESPKMFRRLHHSGRAALDATGHSRDVILLGETAPLGSSNRGSRSPIRPKRFLREVFCVNATGQRYRGASARRRGCSDFDKRGPLRATGFGHHPYTKNVGPSTRDRHPDSVTMANASELGQLLDQIAARTKDLPANLPLYMTEFGFETNPPDRFSGVSLDRQAQWNQEGELIAFLNPRIKSMTQFLLRDVPGVRGIPRNRKAHWFTYQSGLFFADGRPKPSAVAYALPFVARPAGDAVSVWGQLRFRPNGVADRVQLQFRPAGGSDFGDVGEPLDVGPGGLGFFQTRVPNQGPGAWRAVWTDGAITFTSLPAPVG